tara:strand:+ start:140 stop:598 length:459 start_codon:yes stop_codon:yes gene_type:complete
MENKLVTQVAIFQLQSREKLEKEINLSLEKISSLGHSYKGIKVWSSDRAGSHTFNAIIEYELALEDLIGSPKSEIKEKISKLKRFPLNTNHTMEQIGLIGMQAFVAQNELFDMTLEESYFELVNKVTSICNLDVDEPISMLEVPTVSVNLNL